MLFAHESIEITHGKTTFKGTLTNAIDKQHPGLLWRAPWTAATHMRGLAPDLPPAPSRKHLHTCVNGYRSEEHTSELQSLMRISYAVFCLTKKTNNHLLCNLLHMYPHTHLINCTNTLYTHTYAL